MYGWLTARIIMSTALAQRQPEDGPIGTVLVWVGVLAGAVLLLGALLMVIRRKTQQWHVSETDEPPFTLDELRQLHREGKLSDDQYAAARVQIIAISGLPGVSAVDPGAAESEADAQGADNAENRSGESPDEQKDGDDDSDADLRPNDPDRS
jgi:hypothetical protein